MKSFELPEEIRRICRTLADAGEDAYLVGGTVRDTLLGEPGGDWDLATTALPAKVMGLFKRVVPTGLAHGTVTVLTGDEKAEITTLRGDGDYVDGRRPSRVTFLSSIEADLARRDFTVNAMAWDPKKKVLHDPFGGQRDLSDRLLRAVGDPAERFAEDGLRVLRAARFAATLGFDVEKQTLDAMPAAAATLAKVSNERKRDELGKLLSAPVPSQGLIIMERGGLVRFVSEDLARLGGVLLDGADGPENAWRLALARVDAAPAELPIRLAALLLDLGVPGAPGEGDPGQWRAAGIRARSAMLARAWLYEMRFERKLIDAVTHLVRVSDFDCMQAWPDAETRRFLSRIGPDTLADVMGLSRADCRVAGGGDEESAALDALEDRAREQLAAGAVLTPGGLAVDGRDLMAALGIAPGPQVGVLLEALLAEVIEHPEHNTREHLIALCRERMNKTEER